MVEGRRRDQWQHTAQVLAMLANTVRDKKKRRKPYKGQDFYPFHRNGRPGKKRVNIKDLFPFFNAQEGGARRQ